MKKILMSALAAVVIVGMAQAQSTPSQDGPPHRHDKTRMSALNLTDAQKTEAKNLRQAQKKEMDDLKTKGDVTPEQRKALHQKYRSQFDALLTPEQRETLKNAEPEGRPKDGRGFKKEAGAGNRSPFMNKELNLTADQQTKLKSYADDFHAKAKDLRANTSLTQDQKREQMRTLSKNYMEQSKTVLNAEQWKKMQDQRSKHKGHHTPTT